MSSAKPKQVVVAGAFDDLRSGQVRFLEEAARLGEVTALLWGDELARRFEGKSPRFPEAERAYLLQAIRFVRRVQMISGPFDRNALPEAAGLRPEVWAVRQSESSAARQLFCGVRGLQYEVIRDEQLHGFPEANPDPPAKSPRRKRVMVTGCYDYVHSGHVRFFEEVSAYGDLIVVLGHDANLRLLKGPGHPMFPQQERRYVVGAIRHVTQAVIATGHGWLDAEPEIQRLKPDIYAVNEDGDQGGKREYCARLGVQYLVLKRAPAPGLPPRSSTVLRGF
ncbi:MAG TPA: adenylyltransferase/cytidyltransferase family protein [Candidatus Paceibacterota bacterium]|nr:adenylyltransferase/cytidyltransferase family protein [Verrucomicrobiota bacterium]HSA12986.1 adenylyltransferase/cytidyltransferase family protein [Candidatus Paceibacterota bacterium]